MDQSSFGVCGLKIEVRYRSLYKKCYNNDSHWTEVAKFAIHTGSVPL